MPIGSDIYDQFAERDLVRRQVGQQEQDRRKQEKAHSKSWWKRGIGQGLLGALPGIVTLNPVQAIAGAAGGFGGEATNHYAFKDKHPEIAGNAAALASLGSGAMTKGLFSQAAGKAGLGGLQETAAEMGKSPAYQAELAKAGSFAPGVDGSSGPAMPQTEFSPITPQSTGASPMPSEMAGPPSPGMAETPEQHIMRLRLMGFIK